MLAPMNAADGTAPKTPPVRLWPTDDDGDDDDDAEFVLRRPGDAVRRAVADAVRQHQRSTQDQRRAGPHDRLY